MGVQLLTIGAAVFRLMGDAPEPAAAPPPVPTSFWAISSEASPWVVAPVDSTTNRAKIGTISVPSGTRTYEDGMVFVSAVVAAVAAGVVTTPEFMPNNRP